MKQAQKHLASKALTAKHRKAAVKTPVVKAEISEPHWGENEDNREDAERKIGWLGGVAAGTRWGHPLG